MNVSAHAQKSTQTDSLLSLVQTLYNNGSFVSAELEARRLIDHPDVDGPTQIAAEEVIAFSLIAQGRGPTAREHFVSILRKDTSYALDPLMTSPKIMSVFEEARRQVLQERSTRADLAERILEEGQPGPSFRLILFPGWDQVHQGRRTKGTILLGAGALSLGSTVVFDLLRRSARDDYLSATVPAEASARYDDYNRYYKAEYYSAAAFVVVYFYSAFDAFFDLPPRLDARALPDGSGAQLSISVPL